MFGNRISKEPVFLKTRHIGLLLIFTLSANAFGQNCARSDKDPFEGVYEFVSQETTTTKPKKEKHLISAPEWVGSWHLSQGYFSMILMRKKRTKYAEREKYDADYDSFGGTYTVEDGTLTLIPNYALRPADQDAPIYVEFKLSNNILTLTQILRPYVGDIREGTIVTTLRKISP